MTLIAKFVLLLVVVVSALSACDGSQSVRVATQHLPANVTQQDTLYALSMGDTRIEMSSRVGGRISSLKIAQQELLFTPSMSNSILWGNIFWSSPQIEWSWPPIETLDSAPYDVSVEGERLVFTSKIDEQTGYQFVKSYGVDDKKKCLSIHYTIRNLGQTEKSVAGWEVTLVPPTGAAFFPLGDDQLNSGIWYPLPVEKKDNIVWFFYDAKKIQDSHHKLMADGKEGWIAYMNKGKILIKEFADVPPDLISDTEVQLFAKADKTYWEVDQQSALTQLAPGASMEWTVLWHTRTLPENLQVVSGNNQLVDYVHDVLNGRQ